MLFGCSSGPTTISTYVEVEFHHGLNEIDGPAAWQASADGHAGVGPWERNGPRPPPGTCVAFRFFMEQPGVALPSHPMLEVDGVGAYELSYGAEPGSLVVDGATGFPVAPFVTDGTVIALSLDPSAQVETTVPAWPELIAPTAGAILALRQPIHFEWSPHGEDHVSIVLSLFTDAFAFRGALKCNVPDSGAYDLAGITDDIPTDVTRANVQLRTEHYSKGVFDETLVELFVRQFSSRAYTAAPN